MKPERVKSAGSRATWVLGVSVGLCFLQTTPVTAQTSPATLPDLKLCSSATVFDLALQEDGKIIISGIFNLVNDVPRTNLARLNPNGTVDLTWNPKIGGMVYSIVPSGTNIYLGGAILVLGDFTRVYGLVRLSTLDGSIDGNW